VGFAGAADVFGHKTTFLATDAAGGPVIVSVTLPICRTHMPLGHYSARIHSGRRATLPSRAASIRARVFSFSLGIRARMGR